MQNKLVVNGVIYISKADMENFSCKDCAAMNNSDLCHEFNKHYDCYEDGMTWHVQEPSQAQELDQGEILDIMQEECAEVIQAVSKVRRFGPHNHHPQRQQTNQEELEEEVGDLLAMVDLLYATGLLRRSYTQLARQAKTHKLQQYSKVYK